MSVWIIAAALGSVAVTALLTFVLWRMNAPLRAGADAAPIDVDDQAALDGTSDGGSDGGGGGGK
jgi:hypothetical protein